MASEMTKVADVVVPDEVKVVESTPVEAAAEVTTQVDSATTTPVETESVVEAAKQPESEAELKTESNDVPVAPEAQAPTPPASEIKPAEASPATEVTPAAVVPPSVTEAAATPIAEPADAVVEAEQSKVTAATAVSPEAKPVNVSLLVTGENAVSLLLAVNDEGSGSATATRALEKEQLVRVSLVVDAEQMVNVKLDTVEAASLDQTTAPKKLSPIARLLQFFQKRGTAEVVKAQVAKPVKATTEPAPQRPAFGKFGCCAYPAVQSS